MFDLDQVPVPDLKDPNFAPFWEGTSNNKLRIQQCSDCKTHRWPPRITCRKCRSIKSDWVEVEPRGTLFTFTIVGRPTAKGYSKVPYTVGFVTLDAHPHVRIIGNVVDIEPSDVKIGMALEGRFVKAGPNGEMTLIHWVPVKA